MSKQNIVHKNAQRFNEDFVALDLELQDLENNIPVCMGDGFSKYST